MSLTEHRVFCNNLLDMYVFYLSDSTRCWFFRSLSYSSETTAFLGKFEKRCRSLLFDQPAAAVQDFRQFAQEFKEASVVLRASDKKQDRRVFLHIFSLFSDSQWVTREDLARSAVACS